MLAFALHNVDALNGAVHGNCAVVGVNVRPFQTANLSDTQASGQTDIDTEVAECEVLFNEIEDLLVVCHRQHLNFLVGLSRRVFDIPLAIAHPLVLYSELHHHFQDYQNVLYRFNTESAI